RVGVRLGVHEITEDPTWFDRVFKGKKGGSLGDQSTNLLRAQVVKLDKQGRDVLGILGAPYVSSDPSEWPAIDTTEADRLSYFGEDTEKARLLLKEAGMKSEYFTRRQLEQALHQTNLGADSTDYFRTLSQTLKEVGERLEGHSLQDADLLASSEI